MRISIRRKSEQTMSQDDSPPSVRRTKFLAIEMAFDAPMFPFVDPHLDESKLTPHRRLRGSIVQNHDTRPDRNSYRFEDRLAVLASPRNAQQDIHAIGIEHDGVLAGLERIRDRICAARQKQEADHQEHTNSTHEKLFHVTGIRSLIVTILDRVR